MYRILRYKISIHLSFLTDRQSIVTLDGSFLDTLPWLSLATVFVVVGFCSDLLGDLVIARSMRLISITE